MDIITKEMLADTVVKNILSPYYKEYMESCAFQQFNFDEWMHSQINEDFGMTVYSLIGDMYGDLDEAVTAIGLDS